MVTFLIATRNAHKVGEIQKILGDSFQYLTLKDFPGAPEVSEDASTFAGNATKKAVELAQWLVKNNPDSPGLQRAFVLADDSGLEVDALGGAPGVRSARFAALDTGKAGNSTDAENCSKLLRLLEKFPVARRAARFRCVIAIVEVRQSLPVDEPKLFSGVCEGKIIFQPQGQNGFGYDPLFVPFGYRETFAELGEEVKNSLSHRARALAELKKALAGGLTSE